MSSGMPELGSKISLISKADIRYEGRLFTVDPDECTIALASVRSFGTEDRDTQYPVPAQNQVYDYILFRGSDIKDIRVVNSVSHPQPLNDPAIMQLSVPPSLGGQAFQNHPVLGPMAPQMGQFAAGYGSIGAMTNALGQGVASNLGLSRESRMSGGKSTTSVLDFIGGSRSTTPASIGSRKSPTNDQGVQTGNNKQDDKKVIKPIQPPNVRNQQWGHQRERKDSRDAVQNQGRQPRGYNNHDNFQRPGGYQNYQGGQNYHHMNQRNNWSNSRGPVRSRGRSRGSYRNPSTPNNKTKNVLKFDNDFDFEQANTQFEELRSQLGKVKLDEAASSSTKSDTNGDVDKKDDSGNETAAGDTEQDEEHEVYYDKRKSFFDNISCESVERAKGKSQRTDWRMERKLNSETFGVAATRRGNYRGRGGFRAMNYRGGYRPNYRQTRREIQQPQQHSSQGNRFTQKRRVQNQKTQVPQKVSQNVQLAQASNQTDEKKEDIKSDSEPEAQPTVGNELPNGVTPEPAMAGTS